MPSGVYKRKPVPAVERFRSKVDRRGPSECWLWTGSGRDGYGTLSVNGAKRMATHVAVWLATGEWPTRHVCHTCDVPACVNPSHLFQGTDADNHKDKQRKGRAAKKLDADMVRAIRAAVGLSQRELAQLAEVSRMTIANVLHYRTWNHLED